ncbi:MAG: hypothetical protein R2764_00680 [Bacteroidales bacterium]
MSKKTILLLVLSSLLLMFGLKAQDASIFFNVDMSYQISLGNFDPNTEFVDLAGTFNGWGSNLTVLSDDDQDYIYDIELSGFYISQTIEFKFRQNGAWTDRKSFREEAQTGFIQY